ncbi:hypothetical protein CEXT_458581 [Caerostris extrusa]|uniref:Uncharacterized protein n=1 Tax=Caerostris extrusa TaxID=172846 RepID=A0AAV4VSP1_CAEEX|nr:hypothetical protein CEXT_458581 [Caerostris extrusa]
MRKVYYFPPPPPPHLRRVTVCISREEGFPIRQRCVSARSVFISNFFTTPCGKFNIFHLHLHSHLRRVTVMHQQRGGTCHRQRCKSMLSWKWVLYQTPDGFPIFFVSFNYYKENC